MIVLSRYGLPLDESIVHTIFRNGSFARFYDNPENPEKEKERDGKEEYFPYFPFCESETPISIRFCLFDIRTVEECEIGKRESGGEIDESDKKEHKDHQGYTAKKKWREFCPQSERNREYGEDYHRDKEVERYPSEYSYIHNNMLP